MNPAPRLHIGFAQDNVQLLNQGGRTLDDHRPSLYNFLSLDQYECFSSETSGLSSQLPKTIISEDLNLANAASNTSDGRLTLVPGMIISEYDAGQVDGRHTSSVSSVAGLDQYLKTGTTKTTENRSSSIANEDPFFTHRASQDREKARTPLRNTVLNLTCNEQQQQGTEVDESRRNQLGLDPTIQKAGFSPSPVESLCVIQEPDNGNLNNISNGLDADVADYQAVKYRRYLSALIAAGYD